MAIYKSPNVEQNNSISLSGRLHNLLPEFFPFLLWLPKVNISNVKNDSFAAFASAIFALPQGIAFALIAGLPAEFGLYAAIIAPIVTALFGSSWHAVSGPTVATSIVIVSILSNYAVPQSPQFIGLALIITLIAGCLQFFMGVFRFGSIVNFISHTVILGFSTGAAVLIIGSQLKFFLGLNFPRQDSLIKSLYETYINIENINLSVLFISISTLLIAVLFSRFYKKLPCFLIAMIYGAIVSTIMILLFDSEGINMVGALPRGLPEIIIPEISWFHARDLFASAIAIATLGLIQSVSISRTIATKTEQRIDANKEFMAQGLSNIVCSITNGFFSSCSFTRTGVNYSAGAKTPLSSIIASGFILLFLLVASEVTTYLPISSMSAIIILIGWKLIDINHIRKILKTSRTETAVFFITFLSTLFLSLEFAIYSGMFLSLVMYLQKTSTPQITKFIVDTLDPYHRLIPYSAKKQDLYPKISIIRIDGSIFFGSINYIRSTLERRDILNSSENILLIFNGVNLIDVSGAELLLLIKKSCNKHGGDLYLSGLTAEVRYYLLKSPYWRKLGSRKNIFNYQSEAVTHLNQLIEKKEKHKFNEKLKNVIS